MNDSIKTYMKRVKAMIALHSKEEKVFLGNLKHEIEISYENNEVANYEELVNVYGSPNEVAASYLETQDPDRFIKHLKIKKMVAALIILIATIVIIVGCFKIYRYNQLYNEIHESIFLQEETTITELD